MVSALSVFFSGLIAFVDGRTTTSAYAVSSNMHVMYVILQPDGAPQGSLPDGTTCDRDREWWYCKIEKNVDLVFDPLPSPFTNSTELKPNVARPLNATAAAETSWLLRMANVDRSRRRLKTFSEISSSIRLKMEFPWKEAKVCHLDQMRENGEGFQIYPIGFFKKVSGSPSYAQAVAESVRFSLEFPSDTVKVSLRGRGLGEGLTFTLRCASGKCPAMYVSNDALSEMEECEDIGPHFGEYYELAIESQENEKTPVRLTEAAVPLSVGIQQLNTCEDEYQVLREVRDDRGKRHGIETRVICPMVMFDK